MCFVNITFCKYVFTINFLYILRYNWITSQQKMYYVPTKKKRMRRQMFFSAFTFIAFYLISKISLACFDPAKHELLLESRGYQKCNANIPFWKPTKKKWKARSIYTIFSWYLLDPKYVKNISSHSLKNIQTETN